MRKTVGPKGIVIGVVILLLLFAAIIMSGCSNIGALS